MNDDGFTLYLYLVCSTTLWVGQVDKKATQQDLTNLFEEFGQIESINVSRSVPVSTWDCTLSFFHLITLLNLLSFYTQWRCVVVWPSHVLCNLICICACVRAQMIPPRGCAYICMVHRQDAYRARQKLSTGSFKIGSKVIKVHITFL